ncbi:MAG: arginine--tRNA ligase [Candidatus Nealsonbacteria bacterium CG08_land_8_20_14_0_20_43_11]|uniref:Arginine--tRNA ligase n=1 Tax=Candidatus Nealsonbacteria bacterium CG08_land_8_20_14_0_20_43_11 TaxID=1974706 RepID=A0A2M6T0Z2_9BACT|nr:MAG: arginine--tRNA ligase [Candidatus Nealsonbacteria bacterium CG08_land_8_20_14_0_20_43_11]
METIKEKISSLVEKAIKENQAKGFLPDFGLPPIIIETPEEKEHGDYATNIALRIGGAVKRNPWQVAETIIAEIKALKPDLFAKIEIAGPGFINFFLSEKYLQAQVAEILKEKENYGDLKIGAGKKIQVEFISANPTGPLTLGNARGGFFGDVLANVLQKAGFKVEKAYYINDYGMQVLGLGHSVLKDSEAVYKGDYIDGLSKKIRTKDPYKAGEMAAKRIIKEIIAKTVAKMGIKYDEWISETKLHQTGWSGKALAILKEKDLLYEDGGAVWFKAKKLGDSRDRVVIKQDGWKTYLAGDAGLHLYKFSEKKFAKVINIWGADHYGDVSGLQAVVEALGHKGKLEIILLQFVTLVKEGKPFKMSKRLGTYVTVDELLEMANLDAARFFFLTRSPDTHLNFDLDLAREQSEKNPVYYVQYGHARICSIIRKIKNQKLNILLRKYRSKNTYQNLKILNHQSEIALMKQLIRFPEIVEETAKDYQVQRLPQYAIDLATSFHQFYGECWVISEDKNLSQARLALVLATKTVLKNTLDLMGISAPARM